mmetsp:Transcript_23677/g.65667  ORF Transcript_23677/g.65667 Transcript_23677/m.65667 type:complete len:276 (+) Transcript_23677:2728-3555(+)
MLSSAKAAVHYCVPNKCDGFVSSEVPPPLAELSVVMPSVGRRPAWDRRCHSRRKLARDSLACVQTQTAMPTRALAPPRPPVLPKGSSRLLIITAFSRSKALTPLRACGACFHCPSASAYSEYTKSNPNTSWRESSNAKLYSCRRAIFCPSVHCFSSVKRMLITLPTGRLEIPHGTISEKGAKSFTTLSARPWYVIHLVARTPIAATLWPSTQTPVRPSILSPCRPDTWSSARMTTSSSIRKYQCRSFLWFRRLRMGYITSCPGPWYVTSPPLSVL